MKKPILIISLICAAAIVFGLTATVFLLASDGTKPGETDESTVDTPTGDIVLEPPTTDAADTETDAETSPDLPDTPSASEYLLSEGRESLGSYLAPRISEGFIEYIDENYSPEVTEAVAERVRASSYEAEDWFSLTGKSVYVLWGEYSGEYGEKYRIVSGADIDSMTFAFGGDISLADNWTVMSCYKRRGEELSGIISDSLVDFMRSCDITALNNEFAVTERGHPIDKTYTFRSKPENLELYAKMGVDFVSLANNHACDYGHEGLSDTVKHLNDAYIDHAGAGENLAEAAMPFYYIINGRKIAILCGSRAEKNLTTPLAGEQSYGVFGMYDPENMAEAIRSAKSGSDLVIVFAHWGREDSPVIEDVIRNDARLYADSGADLIIGSHAHQLQGVEYFGDTPVFYNLGNFLFEEGHIKTGMVLLELGTDLEFTVSFIPCIQTDCYTYLCEGEEKKEVLEYLLSLSSGVNIAEDGTVSPKV